jgi:UDP-GlcNAc:undecaprenyl-phosphate GlcNAc-1-phosphate transferase
MTLPAAALVPLAAVLGAAATAGARSLALRLRIVSRPDPYVAQHTAPVALLGGVALAAATAAALALDTGRASVGTAMVAGALLFLGAGLLDDVHGLSPPQKLALQVGAAAVPAALGATLPISGSHALNAAAAVIWVVVLVNAVNLTDVCDGLVAGLGAIAAVALGAVEPALWAPCLAVCGACLGFLVFNAAPASIFLGDAGSNFVGFALAELSLQAVRETDSMSRLVSGALVAGLFLFELVFVTTARAGRGEPWWRGSADHFSLRLQAAGLSRLQTDAVAWTAGAALAVAGWAFVRLPPVGRTALVVLVVAALAAISRRLLRWDAAPVAESPGRVHFIVGMSRCGITPLSRCLNMHPDVAVFGESRFFGRYYVEPQTADGYSREQLDRILRVLRQFRWKTTVGDEPGCLRTLSLDGFRELLAETFAQAQAPITPGLLFTTLAGHVADAEGKRYAFEKTPHHVNWFERIVRHVPRARFLVFLCEPYAFARFHREHDAHYHPLAAALLWRGYVRSYERASRRYADRIVVVDAAELARDGTRALERVQRFFGLEVHDLSRPLAGASFAAAAEELDPVETFWINLMCGRVMRRRGYARTPTPVAPRGLVRSLVSFPRWCTRALPRIKGKKIDSTRYVLHWLRP